MLETYVVSPSPAPAPPRRNAFRCIRDGTGTLWERTFGAGMKEDDISCKCLDLRKASRTSVPRARRSPHLRFPRLSPWPRSGKPSRGVALRPPFVEIDFIDFWPPATAPKSLPQGERYRCGALRALPTGLSPGLKVFALRNDSLDRFVGFADQSSPPCGRGCKISISASARC